MLGFPENDDTEVASLAEEVPFSEDKPEIKLTHFDGEFEKEFDTVKKKVDEVGTEVSRVKTRIDGLEQKSAMPPPTPDKRASSPDIESQSHIHSESFADNIRFL